MKVKVRMTVSMAGPTMYRAGGEYEFPENEAIRLEEHGKCVILSDKPETPTVEKPTVETPTVETAHIGPNQSPNQPRKKNRKHK